MLKMAQTLIVQEGFSEDAILIPPALAVRDTQIASSNKPFALHWN